MAKFTLIEGSSTPSSEAPQAQVSDAEEAIKVLRDFLKIDDPAVQEALAHLIAALARVTT